MINIKTQEDIAKMRAGGAILARILRTLSGYVEPGFNTKEFNILADGLVREAGATPSFKGYQGYPASVCVSVNDEIVHGLPRDYTLKEGDIVSLDLGVFYEGLHTDSAITVPVGSISAPAKKLIAVTKEALAVGIDAAGPGITTGDLGYAIQQFVAEHGLGNVRELVGHGVGKKLQEEPMIPNFGSRGKGVELKEGMTIAIEPMLTIGTDKVVLAEDEVTYKTADGSLAAHFEHTVVITSDGVDILTQETS